jgi:hypothetical protein
MSLECCLSTGLSLGLCDLVIRLGMTNLAVG